MDYINNTLAYLKSSLDTIKSALSSTKDVLLSIGSIIGTIADVFGFIGFRVFLLLITTALIMWLLNLASPINRKTNYFIAVGLVIWIALNAKMPLQIVVLKYIFMILSPFVITKLTSLLIKNFGKLLNIIRKKIVTFLTKINYTYTKKPRYELLYNDKIAMSFLSDLPSKNDIKIIEEYLKSQNFNLVIFENEKISLVDKEGKVIIPEEIKFNQLKKSLESKDIKLLWFWSETYGAGDLLGRLKEIKKIKQNKYIIGSGDNGYILNFLQEKWNWKVIYGKNLKDFIENDDYKIENIFKNKDLELALINNHDILTNYFIKEKVVGGDLSSVVSCIGTSNQLNLKNKIIFLDGIIHSKKVLHNIFTQLINFIIDNNQKPKGIIFGNLSLESNLNTSKIIINFMENLKNSSINIPIFNIKDFDFISLNTDSIIEYVDNKLFLTQVYL